jgi:hypothetical protein
MHLSGLKVPPLGSAQDNIFRSAFLKTKVRELRGITLFILAQGGQLDPSVRAVFKDHAEDLTYTEGFHKKEEQSLLDKYEEIRYTTPILSKDKDGSLKVTDL